MITRLQVLPSLYQMQREGMIGDIHLCARHKATLLPLLEDEGLKTAFPGLGFTPHPPPDAADGSYPDLYKEVLDGLAKGSVVYVAIPDQFHHEVVCAALDRDHHVVCVKPLVLTCSEAEDIRKRGFEKGLFVGVEYHKRYDDRSFIARDKYRSGKLGEFKLGQAVLHEKWWYRESNFMNWCTTENSDFFTYIGCHYVDLLAFVTGLKPVSVSVYGIPDAYPNGNVGYLYTDARIVWENGGVLNVQNGIAYPNDASAGNDQGMKIYTKDEASGKGGFICHVDNNRGASYCTVTKGEEPGATHHQIVNPDYFQLVKTGSGGLRPVGYGYRAIEQLVKAAIEVSRAGSLEERQASLRKIDEDGFHATPANSFYNELVVEAGRQSILSGGHTFEIRYVDAPGVAPVKWNGS